MPLDKLIIINQKVHLLRRYVYYRYNLLNDFLNNGDVIGIKSNLEILVT